MRAIMPDWKQILRIHLSPLRLPPEREMEIVEEIAAHLEAVYEEALSEGAAAPEAEARALGMLADGRLLECELARVERPLWRAHLSHPPMEFLARKRRGGMLMDSLLQDLRYGLRGLLKNPSFAVVAVLTLALGIGANTAMFSVVNAVLLRPLPFPDPERLMKVEAREPNNFAAPDFRDLATQNHSFSHLAAYTNATFNLSGGREPERINAARVSVDLLPTLGVEPLLGRNFTAEEDRDGGERVVLLKYGVWQRQFGGDLDI